MKSHPATSELERFLLGQVAEAEAERIQAHFSTCGQCLKTLAKLNPKDAIVTAMQAQAQALASPDDVAIEGLMHRINDLPSSRNVTTTDNVGPIPQAMRNLNESDGGKTLTLSEMLPLVYDELRKLAAQKLGQEKPGQTLQPTALVHEAYLRLMGTTNRKGFANRRHFFVAAAEAMRRILVERSRKKASLKRGGNPRRVSMENLEFNDQSSQATLDLLAIHDFLDQLSATAPRKAELVKLRYFAGCTLTEIADILQISLATAEKDWTYAKAWLRRSWLEHQSSIFDESK